jgi:hypothetical protein
MGKRKFDDETIVQMQKDRESGMTLKSISEKYGATVNLVAKYTSNYNPEFMESTMAERQKWSEWREWDIVTAKLRKLYGKEKKK